jgi:hypothetical protein
MLIEIPFPDSIVRRVDFTQAAAISLTAAQNSQMGKMSR